MSNKDKCAQIKKYTNIHLPKNIKKAKIQIIIENKNNKDDINKVFTRNQKEDYFNEYNNKIKAINNLPPKTTRTYLRGNSEELRKDKKNSIRLKSTKKAKQLKGKVKPQNIFKRRIKTRNT